MRFSLLLLFVPGCMLGAGRHQAAAPPAVTADSPNLPAPQTLTLSECIQTALSRQPRIAAQRASLEASEDGKRALDNLRLPGKLDPQVPYRRQQACLGLSAAAAGLDKAQRDTTYAVTRNYFTVVFAREQQKVAQAVLERLTAVEETAQRALDAGARDVSATDLRRTKVYQKLAEARQVQAAEGVKRALAALREAIGYSPDAPIDIMDGSLPEPQAQPEREAIVAAATMKRGEMIQIRVFAQVASLEVSAQQTSHSQRMQTFAAGTDIHAQSVPSESRGAEYRPGGVPPEMPTLLVGSRAERMKHAQSLQQRAENNVETTKNLIALEAEDAFLRWEEAMKQAAIAKQASDEGERMANDLRKQFTTGLKVRVEEVVTARVLASQARSEYNEYLYKQIVALADLERISVGEFSAGLSAMPVAPANQTDKSTTP